MTVFRFHVEGGRGVLGKDVMGTRIRSVAASPSWPE